MQCIVLLPVQLIDLCTCAMLAPPLCRTGKATYENGAVYEGDFQKDHRWGWGLQRFPDGSTYEGEWYDDLIEGGTTPADRILQWRFCLVSASLQGSRAAAWQTKFDSFYHLAGKGRWSYPDGSYFEGELGNGRRVRGRFVSGDGS